MNARTWFAACLIAAALPALARQVPLKEQQITESALIDALAPAAAPAAPLRTRSIRVIRDDEPSGSSAPAGAGGKPPSAPLLITFETNSAVLTAPARRALDVVGKALASEKLASFRFGIEGHADPRGGAAVNLQLSQARAESVRDYLVNSKHIDAGRLEPVGKGDRDLMNKSDPIAAENRRVTLVNLSR
jgi:outer membrane protein OmpA-like peptidoglycan-associated protein